MHSKLLSRCSTGTLCRRQVRSRNGVRINFVRLWVNVYIFAKKTGLIWSKSLVSKETMRLSRVILLHDTRGEACEHIAVEQRRIYKPVVVGGFHNNGLRLWRREWGECPCLQHQYSPSGPCAGCLDQDRTYKYHGMWCGTVCPSRTVAVVLYSNVTLGYNLLFMYSSSHDICGGQYTCASRWASAADDRDFATRTVQYILYP